MEKLETRRVTTECSLYEAPPSPQHRVQRFIASTPQTRAICNDPFVVGVRYTESLKLACTTALRCLSAVLPFELREEETAVLHILRGGLNFGLREAAASAFSWNHHASAFVSAQRARKSESSEDWLITESSYQKVFLPHNATIIFGDVVATGTSLSYALKRILQIVEEREASLQSILFFTIGGRRAEEILYDIDSLCRIRHPHYRGSAVVYFEGIFDVATEASKLSIRYTGTDLLRSNAVLAPEFIESQYQSPSYPIERCTIYDAGSRAFWLPEYFADVREYWQKTAELSRGGMTFEGLLRERFPELDRARFGKVSLPKICEEQIRKVPALAES